jgi:hypothetical protein
VAERALVTKAAVLAMSTVLREVIGCVRLGDTVERLLHLTAEVCDYYFVLKCLQACIQSTLDFFRGVIVSIATLAIKEKTTV